MTDSSNVTPFRSGAKANPESVFAACDQLRDAQGDFTIEEVRAQVGGGGLSTVTRLVQMYRAHQGVIEQNAALTGEATIGLVQLLDKLLQQRLENANRALQAFESGAGRAITELGEELEHKEAELAQLKETVSSLEARRQSLETDLVTTEHLLADRTRELAESRSREALLEAEIKRVQTVHAAQWEESDRAHQRQLAEALETQRQAMEQARNHALEKAEQGWAQQLAQVRGQAEELEKKHEKKLEQTHEALAASKQREHALQLKLQTRESELKTQARVHMEKQAHQTAVIDEKHQALEATRKAQRELIESIERQRVIETDDLEGRLRQLYRVTDEVTTALGNIQSLLDGIHMDAPDNEADD